jgi:hypothetical protein
MSDTFEARAIALVQFSLSHTGKALKRDANTGGASIKEPRTTDIERRRLHRECWIDGLEQRERFPARVDHFKPTLTVHADAMLPDAHQTATSV